MSTRVIVRAELASPPSDATAFRELTMYLAVRMNATVYLEIEPEYADLYRNWMEPKGLLDYVERVVAPNEISGIFIGLKRRCSETILIDRITTETVQALLREMQPLISRHSS